MHIYSGFPIEKNTHTGGPTQRTAVKPHLDGPIVVEALGQNVAWGMGPPDGTLARRGISFQWVLAVSYNVGPPQL